MIENFNILEIPNYGTIKVGDKGTIIGKKNVPMHPSNRNEKGYYRAHIGNRFYCVHRLVAMAFIPNPKGLPQVNHKDGNKANNVVSNLEWASGSENVIHAHLNGLSADKLSFSQVKEIRRKYATGTYTYKQLGDEYGVTFSNIGYIIRKGSWDYP